MRPLALSPDGRCLYALNTADDRLEIFDAEAEQLRLVGETAVGLRPVAIALCGGRSGKPEHNAQPPTLQRLSNPATILVINYIAIPLTGSVSLLARSGFVQLRAHGRNDGLALLSDLIVPGASLWPSLAATIFCSTIRSMPQRLPWH